LIAAIATVLNRFFSRDALEFTVRSSAPGVTVNPRAYTRVSDVMQEVVDARINQGIRFRFADDAGRRQGKRIGRWTYEHHLQPSRHN
jgi:hypothetical protein